ncbi:hypothetical protein [Shewanella baltica]|uniref:hypothetical protein n=1 Tax=Shewanella baltica TaxID=62322 RepID=UPI003D7A2F06
MRSKEYMEGFKANSYSENPYDTNTHEFDEFERGRTQRIKRTGAGAFSLSYFDDVLEPSEFDNVKRLVMPEITTNYRYKNIKRK